MKKHIIIFILFVSASLSVGAQDMIILKDGTAIEAQVMIITPTQIMYKRFDQLNGPTIAIPLEQALSIRYENGTYEVINAAPASESAPAPAAAPAPKNAAAPATAAARQQKSAQAKRPAAAAAASAMDPDKLIFGMNLNPGGAVSDLGASASFELSKGNFNNEINFVFPSLSPSGIGGGFGFITTFNYVWNHRIGGLYLGGGLGYIFTTGTYNVTVQYTDYTHEGTTTHTEREKRTYLNHYFTFGANVGYKFVTRSGVYFRTGIYLGAGVYGDSNYDKYNNSVVTSNSRSGSEWAFLFKPDVAAGYCFK